jgi:2-methylcitrate dehydratase PrpD
MLARSGLNGTPTIFEGPQGYFQAVGGNAAMANLVATDTLGARHRILDTLYKVYPSAGANQSAIYAADVAYHRHRLDPSTITSVRVLQYPLFGRAVRLSTGKPAYPSIVSTGPYLNVEETLPNKPFGVASMLLYGHHDHEAIQRGLRDRDFLRLAETVSSEGEESFGPFDASIEIHTRDGQRIVERVSCESDPRFFPTMASMPDRFATMCSSFPDKNTVAGLIHHVDQLDKPAGADALIKFVNSIGNLHQPMKFTAGKSA